MSEYTDALRREAAGYVQRGNARALEAVNRELARLGEPPVQLPTTATDRPSKPAARTPRPRKKASG